MAGMELISGEPAPDGAELPHLGTLPAAGGVERRTFLTNQVGQTPEDACYFCAQGEAIRARLEAAQ